MTWNASSVVICDDVRIEASGKQILIGVYSGDIIVPSFPASIYQIIFRVDILPCGENFSDMHFSVKGSDGISLMEVNANPSIQDPEENSIFVFALRTPTFSKPSQYEIEFGLGNQRRVISSFRVRLPKSPQEVDKIQSTNSA